MERAYEAIQQNTGFFSVEAEESLISALISGASLSDKEGFASQLKSSDFGVPDNAEIFKAICKVLAKRQNPDLITVDAEIAATIPEQSEILGNKIIDIVRTRLATRFNADGYISVIRELSARRMAIRSVQEALRKLTDPTKDLNEIMDNLTSMAVNTANTKGFEWTDMSNVLLQTYDNLEKRFNGQIKPITTGLHCQTFT